MGLEEFKNAISKLKNSLTKIDSKSDTAEAAMDLNICNRNHPN